MKVGVCKSHYWFVRVDWGYRCEYGKELHKVADELLAEGREAIMRGIVITGRDLLQEVESSQVLSPGRPE